MNHDLERLREQIDILDNEIMHALDLRFELVEEVGRLKNKAQMAVIDPQRQQAILEKTHSYTYSHQIETLYQLLFTLSCEVENE